MENISYKSPIVEWWQSVWSSGLAFLLRNTSVSSYYSISVRNTVTNAKQVLLLILVSVSREAVIKVVSSLYHILDSKQITRWSILYQLMTTNNHDVYRLLSLWAPFRFFLTAIARPHRTAFCDSDFQDIPQTLNWAKFF